MKKKRGCLPKIIIAFLVIVVLGAIGSAISGGSGNKKSDTQSATVSTETTTSAIESESEQESELEEPNAQLVQKDWLKYYEENGDYVISVDADVMREYGNYYAGSLACTVVEIADISSDMIKANVDADSDSLTYSFTFTFSDGNEISGYQEGDTVEIVGMIEPQTEFLGATIDTVSLNDCHIVSSGTDAEARREELKSTADTQIKYAQAYVEELEAAAAEEELQNIEEYKSSCGSVDYDDVARNPDNYKGANIVISGTVIQVSEGWFDSVTLRVSDNGNVWYVTYTRSEGESRILEDDFITVYGESSGVTSYTTILGSTVTIPSIKGKIVE